MELGIWFPTVRANTGADIFTQRLAEALEKRGVRTQITWLPHRAEYLPWSVTVPEPPPWANVVHVNSWLHRRFIPPNLTVVVTLHSGIHDPILTPYKSMAQMLYHRTWIRGCEIEAIRSATVVTSVSSYSATQAEKIFSYRGVIPVHNWIDVNVFTPTLRPSQDSPFRLLFVGGMRKLKGADLLKKIMSNLGDDFILRYTGNPSPTEWEVDLPSNMFSIGRLNKQHELVEAYTSSDALLFPTRLEGFGLVALEAQSCGLPVIATNCSSLPEVVEDGVTGFLCQQDNIGEFADAARKLRHDRDLWAAMRIAARERAVSCFSEERAIDKYLELYQTLIPGACSFGVEKYG